MAQYTIRYRCGDPRGRVALIVDDASGSTYLFSEGGLQARYPGRNASARLARLLSRRGMCSPVPEVAPYTLDGLRSLTAPPASPPRAGSREPQALPTSAQLLAADAAS